MAENIKKKKKRGAYGKRKLAEKDLGHEEIENLKFDGSLEQDLVITDFENDQQPPEKKTARIEMGHSSGNFEENQVSY